MKKIALQALLFFTVFFAISIYQIRNHIPRTTDVPLISGQSADGTPNQINLAQGILKSHPTLLYFFAPWCGVCKIAMGNLNILSTFASVNVVIIALDYDNKNEVIDLIKQKNLGNFELVFGDNATKQSFKVGAYPTYYVVSGQGEVFTSSIGYSTTIGMLFRIWTARLWT